MSNSFDDVYKKEGLYYGANPSWYVEMLVKREKVLDGYALDIGCGDGRNTLFLAENGFQVIAIDNSKVAIDKLQKISVERKLNIQTIIADLSRFDFENGKYSLIIANTIIDHLDKDDGDELIIKLKKALKKGGIIFASVFTENDPGNRKLVASSETSQYVKRYFHSGELRNKFSDLTLLRYHEEEFLDTNHGPQHYHFMARIIAKAS
jgi:tellurite methyltransferase